MAADKGDLQTHHLQKRFASITGQPIFVQIPPNKACFEAPRFPTCWKAHAAAGPAPGARSKAAREQPRHLRLVTTGRRLSPCLYLPASRRWLNESPKPMLSHCSGVCSDSLEGLQLAQVSGEELEETACGIPAPLRAGLGISSWQERSCWRAHRLLQLETVLAQPDFLSGFHPPDGCDQQDPAPRPSTERGCSPERCCYGCAWRGSLQPRGPRRDGNALGILRDGQQIHQDGLKVWESHPIPRSRRGASSPSLAPPLAAPQKALGGFHMTPGHSWHPELLQPPWHAANQSPSAPRRGHLKNETGAGWGGKPRPG